MNLQRIVRPTTLEDACAYKSRNPAAGFIAGGTEVVPLMRAGIDRSLVLVDLTSALPSKVELRKDGSLHVGAGATLASLAKDHRIGASLRSIAEAINESASAQIRNIATVGGNLLQRTRCTYFRDVAFPCNKRDPKSGCSAMGHEGKNHAILGGSSACIATHASDLAVAFSAADAEIELRRTGGTRRVSIQELYRSLIDQPHVETVLAADELIASVKLMSRPHPTVSGYLKLRERGSFEFATVSAACVLSQEAGRVKHIAVALGGIASAPWRLNEFEQMLTGEMLTRGLLAEGFRREMRAASNAEGTKFKAIMAHQAVVALISKLAGISI